MILLEVFGVLLAITLGTVLGLLLLRWIFELLRPFYLRIPEKKLKLQPCPTCKGRCLLYLADNKMVPIPDHIDRRDRVNRVFRTPLANTVRCPTCQGLGDIWLKDTREEPKW